MVEHGLVQVFHAWLQHTDKGLTRFRVSTLFGAIVPPEKLEATNTFRSCEGPILLMSGKKIIYLSRADDIDARRPCGCGDEPLFHEYLAHLGPVPRGRSCSAHW